MANHTHFGSALPGGLGLGRDCLPFEAMLADAIDGTLAPNDQKRFEEHLAACESCAGMLRTATEGDAFLDLLRPFPPEPPPDLVLRILEQTSLQTAREAEAARMAAVAAREADSLLGRPVVPVAYPAQPAPASPAGRVLPFRSRFTTAGLRPALHSLMQPRLAMTAAMAFFSVALTFNLTGIHISQLRARNLQPSNLKRSFYEADARLIRYYESFRVVYELESRVRDLQQRSDSDAPSTTPATEQQTAPQSRPGAPEPNRPAGSKDGRSSGNGSESTPGSDSAPGQAGARPGPQSSPHPQRPFIPGEPPAEVLAANLGKSLRSLRDLPSCPGQNLFLNPHFSTKGGLA